MSSRKIFTSERFPKILAAKSEKVVVFNDDLVKLIEDMVDTMHRHSICVGLAAPQIGVTKQVAVINIKDMKMVDLILINPTIIREFGKKDVKMESCMSVPGVRGQVEMRKSLEVSYQDIAGLERTEVFSGFLARVVRHEVDHLNGILYTDRVGSASGMEKTDLFSRAGFGPEHMAEPE